jgi:cell division septation protein DedD
MSTDVRTARQGAEDGFHEIQLSGKQLVFLFMATTVVSIVIFLCGVLVGRGARVEASPEFVEAGAVAPAAQAVPTTGEPVVNSAAPAQAATPGDAGEPTKAGTEDFNYMTMLKAEQSTDEVPQPPAETAAEPPAAAAAVLQPPADPPTSTTPLEKTPPGAAPAPAKAPAAAPTAAAVAPPTPAAGSLTIQVAALKERAEADRIAKRLQAKGYDAYVADPAPGTAMFRVRVGHFGEKSEADKVKNRLAKEEKFRPWVTR